MVAQGPFAKTSYNDMVHYIMLWYGMVREKATDVVNAKLQDLEEADEYKGQQVYYAPYVYYFVEKYREALAKQEYLEATNYKSLRT